MAKPTFSLLFRLTPRDSRSGGMRMIYYFTELLTKIGCKVKINDSYEPSDVVVYPDSLPGNLYKATKVVRFMCYFADAYFGGGWIPKEELVIVYHPNYLEEISTHCEVKPKHILTIPSIEPHTFFPTNKYVDSVVYVGKQDKYNYTKEIPKKLAHYRIINRGNTNRSGLIDYLRCSKNFYSLDYHTITCTEALLCGCNVYHIYGEDDFRPYIIEDPNSMVMNVERDVSLAEQFVRMVDEFFD